MVDTLSGDITDIRVRLRGRYPLMLDGSDMDDTEFYAFCLENNELRNFVLELRSYDQSLPALKKKMEEYITCGCRLGWLVDPQNRCTYVYFENGDIQTVSFDDILGGGSVMPGLEIRMREVMG